MLIKTKGKHNFGKTRSEQARNLQKEGWGNAGLRGEQVSKARFLEKKLKEKYGNRAGGFVNQYYIDKVR